MANETSIKIQVSADGSSWADLATIGPDLNSYMHTFNAPGIIKYYRVKALGNGTTTSDSDWSSAINITSDYTTEYKAILNYAENIASPAIALPSDAQSAVNDAVIRILKTLGVFAECDIFYYFQQQSGTPYEFLTINWANPTDATRLLNLGTDGADFEGGLGLSVDGVKDQYMSTQFNPSTDAIKFLPGDSGCFFRTFGISSTFTGVARIAGCKGATGNQVNIVNGSTSKFLVSLLDQPAIPDITVAQDSLNSHYHKSRKSLDGKYLYKDGTLIYTGTYPYTTDPTNNDIYLFAANYPGTIYKSESKIGLGYIGFSSSLKSKQSDIWEKMIFQKYIQLRSTSLKETLYYPKVYLSADFPLVTTTKKYIITYSTDHALGTPTGGACCWGEFDDFDGSGGIFGFRQNGEIIRGYQAETPDLVLFPNDPNGETIHVYYHPYQYAPGAGGYQQTRLLTRTGGLLHDAGGWTDRGHVLGLTAAELAPEWGEVHTGYANMYKQEDGSFVSIHVTRNWQADTEAGLPNIGKSTNPGNSYVWTRVVEDMDVTSYMPTDRYLHLSPPYYFTYKGTQYVLGRNITFIRAEIATSSKMCICRCDGEYIPVEFISNIVPEADGNSNAGGYLEGYILHVIYIVDQKEIRVVDWDIRNLDAL